MRKPSKRMRAVAESVQKSQEYSLKDAVNLLKSVPATKFDASVDLVFNLNLDVKQSDQQLRGAVALPNGSGKKMKILVVTDEAEEQRAAKEAGADRVATAAELPEIFAKSIDFDVIITDPKAMPMFGRFGKVLGPRGLMPNPKVGTVTPQVAKAVTEVKKGKANYRTDKNGVVHTTVGKVSMDIDKLLQNIDVVIDAIKKAKPSAAKGVYIKSVFLSSTMGPGLKVDVA